MDDRFDMQLITAALSDGFGLDYVTGSFAVVGNDGTHTLNGAITTGTGAPADVLASGRARVRDATRAGTGGRTRAARR